MVVVGVLTVLGVWLLARELADDDKPAVAAPAAALLVAVLPFHTAMSRYVKEDGPIGMWTVVVMLATGAVLESAVLGAARAARPRRRRQLLDEVRRSGSPAGDRDRRSSP